MIAPDEPISKILKALKIRTDGLETEYGEIASEIDATATHLDFLIAEAWDRHDRLVDMRALMFRVNRTTETA